jgi:hypothetical protein
MVLTYNG